MCDNKFARMEQKELVKYTCWQVQENKFQWLQTFKEKNRVLESHSLFQNFRDAIQNFIDKCKHKDLPKEDQDREKEKYEFEQSMKSPFFNKGLHSHVTPEDCTKKTMFDALKDKGVI